MQVFKDWCGNVIRRYAYFVEHGHSWEFDKKEKKYRWLGKDHPYKGGKTKSKHKEGRGGKSQEEEESNNDMPPLVPVAGQQQDNDDKEEEDDSEEEYDPDQHLWHAGSSSWQNPASSSWQQPASSTWQSSTSSSWEDPQWLESRTQKIGGRTTKAEEKMIKMVNTKSFHRNYVSKLHDFRKYVMAMFPKYTRHKKYYRVFVYMKLYIASCKSLPGMSVLQRVLQALPQSVLERHRKPMHL